MKFVELETERLRLRACRADDFDDVFALYSDKENMKYTRNIITNADKMREALARWVSGTGADPCYDFEWIIELKATGEFIGHALVMDFSWQKDISPDLSFTEGHCETGIFILPQHQRRGYGREFKRTVLDFMFESLGCREHVSQCDERNIVSQRVIEGVGMKFEYTWDIPKAVDGVATGETEHRRVYSMSRADWEAARSPMQSTNKLSRVPFSRRGSWLSLALGADGGLELRRSLKSYGEKREKVLRITLPEPFEDAEFSAGALAVGGAKFCFDGADAVRFRGGVTFEPSADFLVADGYICESDYPAEPSVRTFDECAAENERDFEDWYAKYPPVAARFEPTKRLCAYMIWACQVFPRGRVTEPMFLYSKPDDTACFSWHQAYHAMALRDAETAVQTLCSMFSVQDEFGELPDLLDDRYININATKPPVHGLAALKILARFGDRLTRAHCEKMYGGLAKLYEFWTTRDGGDIPSYHHGCESGFDFTRMLAKGVPAQCPDILAFCILLADALAEIAERLGIQNDWREKSARLLEFLVTELWNGEQFVARNLHTGETAETDELEPFTPLILGRRLPPEIRETLVSRLERDYASPYGLQTAPDSGIIIGFSQAFLLPALFDCGYAELGTALLRGYVEYEAEHTPAFLFAFRGELGFDGFSSLSALSAAEWLNCAALLREVADET